MISDRWLNDFNLAICWFAGSLRANAIYQHSENSGKHSEALQMVFTCLQFKPILEKKETSTYLFKLSHTRCLKYRDLLSVIIRGICWKYNQHLESQRENIFYIYRDQRANGIRKCCMPDSNLPRPHYPHSSAYCHTTVQTTTKFILIKTTG